MNKKPDLLEKLDEFIDRHRDPAVGLCKTLDELNKQHIEEIKTGTSIYKQQARLDKIQELAEGLFLQHGGLSMSVCLLNAVDAVDAIDQWRKEQEQGSGDE